MLPKTEATIKTIIFELNKIQCIQDLLKKIMRNHNLIELLGDKGVNLFLHFYLYFLCYFNTFQLYNTVLFTIEPHYMLNPQTLFILYLKVCTI